MYSIKGCKHGYSLFCFFQKQADTQLRAKTETLIHYSINSGELVIPTLGGTVSSKTSVESGFSGDNYSLRWGSVRHGNLICQHITAALVTLIHHSFVCPLPLTQKTQRGNRDNNGNILYKSLLATSSTVVTDLLQSTCFITLSTSIHCHFPFIEVWNCVSSWDEGGSLTGFAKT